jgi:hypothetical protein
MIFCFLIFFKSVLISSILFDRKNFSFLATGLLSESLAFFLSYSKLETLFESESLLFSEDDDDEESCFLLSSFFPDWSDRTCRFYFFVATILVRNPVILLSIPAESYFMGLFLAFCIKAPRLIVEAFFYRSSES